MKINKKRKKKTLNFCIKILKVDVLAKKEHGLRFFSPSYRSYKST